MWTNPVQAPARSMKKTHTEYKSGCHTSMSMGRPHLYLCEICMFRTPNRHSEPHHQRDDASPMPKARCASLAHNRCCSIALTDTVRHTIQGPVSHIDTTWQRHPVDTRRECLTDDCFTSINPASLDTAIFAQFLDETEPRHNTGAPSKYAEHSLWLSNTFRNSLLTYSSNCTPTKSSASMPL